MERLKDIKLIVCDMDGTLLHDDQSMDTQIVEVVKQLHKQGILFTLASGRNVHIMKQFVELLSLDIPYICNNGANIFLKDACLFEQIIEHEDLQYILTLLKSYDFPFLAYSNTNLYGTREDCSMDGFLQRLRGKVDIQMNATIEDIARQDIFKIIVIQEDDTLMKTFMREVERDCHNAHCMRTEGSIYAMNNAVVSKGNALKALLEYLHLNRNQVLVFGDNYNDLQMFDEASFSVAMQNSNDEIKQRATHLAKSNNENGVSEFIKAYIL